MPSFDSPVAALGFAARALALSHKHKFSAESWLREVRAPEQAHRLIRGAVGDADIDLPGGGISISAWSAALRTKSCFFRILDDNGFARVPIGERVAVTVTPATAYQVGEGHPTPLSKLAMQTVTVPRVKAQSLVVITNEQLTNLSSAGQTSVNQTLANSIASAIDGGFLNLITSTDTESFPASGTGAVNVWADLRQAMLAVSASGGGNIYAIASPAVGVMLATLATADGAQVFSAAPNEIANLPLLISEGAPAGEIIIVNASQIAADGGPILPDRARHASIEMSDTPTHNSATPTATSLVSLWQTDSSALRASAEFGALPLNESAVCIISGVDYGGP